MCRVSLRDKKLSEESQNRLGIANITDALQQTRLSMGMLREWIKKTQSIIVGGLLRLAAREGNIDPTDQ